jgi:hypothetical protein
MSMNPFLRPTDDRERRQPPLSPVLGKNTPAIRTLPMIKISCAALEAENLAQFFDSHAATL